MAKITCKFCDWEYEFLPTSLFQREKAHYAAGVHYGRQHFGLEEEMTEFGRRLEEYALLPDPRQEAKR